MMVKDKFENISLLGFLALVIFAVVFGPLLSIWSWNVLFGALYTIPVTLETWFATAVLFSAIKLG